MYKAVTALLMRLREGRNVEKIINQRAYDAAQRRKANRKARQMGIKVGDLAQAQKAAAKKFSKLDALNESNSSDALKAKKAMNEVWIKSGRDYYGQHQVNQTEINKAKAFLKGE